MCAGEVIRSLRNNVDRELGMETDEFGNAKPSAEYSAAGEEFYGWDGQRGPEDDLIDAINQGNQELQEESQEEAVEEPEPSPESETNQELSQETEESASQVDQDYQVEGASQKAQQRIQDLVRERNESREEQSRMAEAIRTLQETIAAQQTFQQQAYERAQQQQDAYQAQQSRQQLISQLQEQSGFDVNDFAHHGMLNLQQDILPKVQNELKELREQLAAYKQNHEQQQYQAQATSALDEVIGGAEVAPEIRTHLLNQVYATAQALGIKDPKQAVHQVVTPMRGLFQAKKVANKRPTGAEKVAHQTVSMSGGKGGRKAGDKASGSTRQPVRQLEDELFPELANMPWGE